MASVSSRPAGQVQVVEQGITWNYTTILNIVALALAAPLLVRFFRTGGREMLSMMGGWRHATLGR